AIVCFLTNCSNACSSSLLNSILYFAVLILILYTFSYLMGMVLVALAPTFSEAKAITSNEL
ncbi:MAG: hypothetical protein U9N49_03995, partial [Campylobacterota bacterium]|nr:hypothetical protein [Campylobacterota bacterium]